MRMGGGIGRGYQMAIKEQILKKRDSSINFYVWMIHFVLEPLNFVGSIELIPPMQSLLDSI